MNEFFLIQLKADCCVIVFTAQATEHILKFAKKSREKNKTKKIKKVKDALKAAPVHAQKKNLDQHALIKISKLIKLSSPDRQKLWLVSVVSLLRCLQSQKTLQHSGNVYLSMFLSDATLRQDGGNWILVF